MTALRVSYDVKRLPSAIGTIVALLFILTPGCGSGDNTTPSLTAQPTPSPTAIYTGEPTKPPTPTLPPGPTPSATIETTVTSLPTAGGLGGFAFADSDHGWVMRGRVLYDTSDGGATWNELYESPQSMGILSFVSLNTGWALAQDNLLRTDDGGRSWSVVSVSGITAPFEARFFDAEHGWAATNKDLVETQDGGATWTTVTNPCPNPNSPPVLDPLSATTLLAACGSVPGAGSQPKWMYRSDDAGASWQLVADSGLETPGVGKSLPIGGYLSDIWFLDDRTGWMSTARGGLQATNDGGATWNNVDVLGALGIVAEPAVGEVQFLSAQKGFVLASAGQGLLARTDDGGVTWRPLFPPPQPVLASSVTMIDDSTGIAAGTILDAGGVLRTVDGGLTWTQVASIPKPDAFAAAGLSFVDGEHGWVLADGAVYGTEDGGATWLKLDLPVQATSNSVAAISRATVDTGFVAMQDGTLFVSHDGGVTFQGLPSLDTSRDGVVTSLQFSDELHGWMVRGNAIHKTTDGGQSWSIVPFGLFAASIREDGTRLWVIAHGAGEDYLPRLLSSSDAGATWTEFDLKDIEPEAIVRAEGDSVWVGSGDGLYHSADGGHTWLRVK